MFGGALVRARAVTDVAHRRETMTYGRVKWNRWGRSQQANYWKRISSVKYLVGRRWRMVTSLRSHLRGTPNVFLWLNARGQSKSTAQKIVSLFLTSAVLDSGVMQNNSVLSRVAPIRTIALYRRAFRVHLRIVDYAFEVCVKRYLEKSRVNQKCKFSRNCRKTISQNRKYIII